MDYTSILAEEFSQNPQYVQAVIDLLDQGNTIPFIARYRKEMTGAMDDQLLRELSERLEYLRRPYRPKRRTRATVAREQGLAPLAETLLAQEPGTDVQAEAARYVDPEKGVADTEAALAGARDILAETFSDDAEVRKRLRELLMREGVIRSAKAKDEDTEAESVYGMYFEFSEPVGTLPAHRILALNRGEREEALKVSVDMPDDRAVQHAGTADDRAFSDRRGGGYVGIGRNHGVSGAAYAGIVNRKAR